MTVELNHTIVAARDPDASARFLAGVLGLPAPSPFGPFIVGETGNRVSLDFVEKDGEINRNDGGRGVYFPDPNGHLLEIITRPYGSG